VKVVECEYEPEQFYEAVGVRAETELAQEPEKGERCRRCYKLRLELSEEYGMYRQDYGGCVYSMKI
jgi:predicted adenine nucleotide alpha hydrolase (AANH) superfamily ATPase